MPTSSSKRPRFRLDPAHRELVATLARAAAGEIPFGQADMTATLVTADAVQEAGAPTLAARLRRAARAAAELPSLLRLLDPQGVRQPLWPVLLESLTGRWPADDSVDLVGELSCGPGVPKRPKSAQPPPRWPAVRRVMPFARAMGLGTPDEDGRRAGSCDKQLMR
jgi:hypothetical protein